MFKKTIEATIREVRLVSIHGQRYYDILYVREGGEQTAHRSRAPFEEVYEQPQPGDQVRIHTILDTVTGVEKIDSTG